MTNTLKLKAKIVESGKTYKEIAYDLGVCEISLRNKINNKAVFKVTEIVELCRILNIEDIVGYFFAH